MGKTQKISGKNSRVLAKKLNEPVAGRYTPPPKKWSKIQPAVTIVGIVLPDSRRGPILNDFFGDVELEFDVPILRNDPRAHLELMTLGAGPETPRGEG